MSSSLRQEGTTGQITLNDDNPDAVQELLRFFYSQSYSRLRDDSWDGLFLYGKMPSPRDTEPYFSASKEWWTQHVEVYRIADKYDIGELKRLSENCILELLRKTNLPLITGWEHLIQAIYDLELAGTAKLKLEAIERADRITEHASRGLLVATRSVELEEPENIEVIRYLLGRNQEELRQARAAHEGRLGAQRLESEAVAEDLRGQIRRLKDLIPFRARPGRARTAALLAAFTNELS